MVQYPVLVNSSQYRKCFLSERMPEKILNPVSGRHFARFFRGLLAYESRKRYENDPKFLSLSAEFICDNL